MLRVVSGSSEDFPHGERLSVSSPWPDTWQAARVHGGLPIVTLLTLIGQLTGTVGEYLEDPDS